MAPPDLLRFNPTLPQQQRITILAARTRQFFVAVLHFARELAVVSTINSRRLWIFASIALLVATTGCSLLATAQYVWNPNDTSAEYDGLEKQKVVVVCRATSSAFSDPTIARDLTNQVSLLLNQNVSKIKIVPEQEVSDWTDKNRWNDYAQIGKALKADKVVGIDLERFSVSPNTTLLQGEASIKVTVHDMKEKGKLVYVKGPKTVKYPPNSPISSAEWNTVEFRNRFVKVLAGAAARNFYEYDSRTLHATDSTALN